MPFTLGVFKTDRPKECGIVVLSDDGLVIDFEEKPEKPKSNLAAAGVYVADLRIFDFFPSKNTELPIDLGYHVIPNLVGKMKAYIIDEFLMDIGTKEAYKTAEERWRVIQFGENL